MKKRTSKLRCGSMFYGLSLSLVTCYLSPRTVLAAQRPSLFRGVVVADSSLGIRVVSVEESSQASLADLRPEDMIVSIDGTEIHSIDEFATLSSALKGRAVSTTLVVFRNGNPFQISLHLYSYPILRAWEIEFIPDYDLRFAQPEIGLAFWRRLGRGFEEAHKPAEALDAYLNGLHNVPTDVATALKVSELSSRLSHEQLDHGNLKAGIVLLTQTLTVMQKLFDYPLTDEQLQIIKGRLTDTLQALHQTTNARQTPSSSAPQPAAPNPGRP